ncbi:MAG TPA: hypothetical protein VMU89_12380 [Thermomicrobiaceae bacterium]|nr:hypothetical protein [Thermomicrobiaceae bacterium]
MTWELALEALPTPAPHDVADAADALLTALEHSPSILGAVTFADRAAGTLGARFDLEAPAVEDAIRAGVLAFVNATRTIGITALAIQRAQAEIVHDPAPVDH